MEVTINYKGRDHVVQFYVDGSYTPAFRDQPEHFPAPVIISVEIVFGILEYLYRRQKPNRKTPDYIRSLDIITYKRYNALRRAILETQEYKESSGYR